RTAQALAAQAGITHVHAEQLPADKATAIAALTRLAPTAMVGDGINDAPALATATVGIAMGVKGSAAAVESADVAFTGEDLRLLAHAFAHARRGRRLMTANIAMSLAIIAGLVPLALLGVLGLAGVVLVHEFTEVIVILNGLRAASSAALRLEAKPAQPAPQRDPCLETA
ncbi:MAG: HAD-IC family P-type ATPase, partial [Propionibacteriaceae bacterium]|nr:HAD-IC family P-type ATPase [Propionibacteriaceae bacterium]